MLGDIAGQIIRIVPAAPDEGGGAARQPGEADEEQAGYLRDAALVHRPERLSELLCALTAAGLEPKRLRTVARTADAAPSLVLVGARRGGKPGLRILPPLTLCAPDGTDSEEIRRIYHRRA